MAAIFDPHFLKRLRNLLVVQRRGGLEIGVDHGSARRGAGHEFKDYRRYAEGDDLRAIDWNIYSRLDELVLKQYEVPAALTVTVILDRTASMMESIDGGDPKWNLARQIAGALGVITLGHHDRLCVATIPSDGAKPLSYFRGRGRLLAFLDELAQVQIANGEPDVMTIGAPVARVSSAGRVFIISDFCRDDFYEPLIRLLLFERARPHLIQITDPLDIDPPMRGLWELTDPESGDEVRLNCTADLLTRYRELARAHQAGISAFARRAGIGYTQLAASTSIEHAIFTQLRRDRVVQ
jgi:uncharacterized protein (DUF58 family)